MKIPGFSKRFGLLDILLMLLIWPISSSLYRSYQSGIIHLKSLSFIRNDNFFMFWVVFIFGIVGVFSLIYLVLFGEFKLKGPKYDQDGNVNKDS